MSKKELFIKMPGLQFFAEEGEGSEAPSFESEEFQPSEPERPSETVLRGGYNPEEEIQFNPDARNPLTETDEDPTDGQPSDEEGNPEQPQDPQPEGQEPPESQFLDFGGRKVDPNDPDSIRGAQQDFLNAQRYITQLAQENQMLKQFQQNPQQQQGQQPQAPEPQQPEEPEMSAAELQELFYDDPDRYMQELQKKITRQVEQKYEPVRKQQETMAKQQAFNEEFNQVSQRYGEEFDRHFDGIKQIAQRIGDQKAEQIGLEGLFLMARGAAQQQQQPQQPQQMPSPDQLVNDPNFVQNHIMNNEQLRQQIINDYLQGKQQNRPPKTINNRQGGAPSLNQVKRPKSIGEAGKLARQYGGF